MAPPDGSRAPQRGDAAPPLALPALDGGPWDLADQRGRLTLLVFLRHAG